MKHALEFTLAFGTAYCSCGFFAIEPERNESAAAFLDRVQKLQQAHAEQFEREAAEVRHEG